MRDHLTPEQCQSDFRSAHSKQAPKEYAKPAFAEAVAVIRTLGAEVVEVDIDRHEVLEDEATYDLVMACEFKSAINQYLAALQE